MSDIFISYKREEQPIAKALAGALERQGWSVWWDPKLRAGEYFDDVIERALRESKCVIVLWSKRSVKSRYVRDEAIYALQRRKLVPIAIEDVSLPFRFEGIQTVQLPGWDGSVTFPGFEKILRDLKAILDPAPVENPFNTPQPGRLPIQSLPTPKLEPVALEPDGIGFLRYFTLRWTEVNLAKGYVLEKSNSDYFIDAKIEYEGKETSFGSYGLIMPLATYGYYRVKAKGQFAFVDSEWSNSVYVHSSTIKMWSSSSTSQ